MTLNDLIHLPSRFAAMAKKHRRAKVISRSINKRRKEKTKGRADLKFDFRLQSVSDNWDSHKTLKQLRIDQIQQWQPFVFCTPMNGPMHRFQHPVGSSHLKSCLFDAPSFTRRNYEALGLTTNVNVIDPRLQAPEDITDVPAVPASGLLASGTATALLEYSSRGQFTRSVPWSKVTGWLT